LSLTERLVTAAAAGERVELASLGEELEAAKRSEESAEEAWLELAAEAEDQGLKT